ncbi:MAG: DUF115 domain-containing protein [Treponema sp.]|jgi:hypothetical protein|nr:DUF115 domain-containing protein [Treponema sp.]
MDKQYFFERNLLALSRAGGDLCSRLSGAETTLNRYKFLTARSGEEVPALVDPSGAAHPLHSLVDPRREGRRIAESVKGGGFLIILGLGGGFHAAAVLEQEDFDRVLVIDYDINGMAELLCSGDYVPLFKDPRFYLLADPSPKEIEDAVLALYQPVLSGGIRVLPLRSRTALDNRTFLEAGRIIEGAIEKVSADYSVQAYFGKRWFSNILRNLPRAAEFTPPLPPIGRAAVSAAGPSLDRQLPLLKKKRGELFLLAADTSLPKLLSEGIRPDGVVSIDCQHISYYHFMAGLPPETLLFVDLASPPLIASCSLRPRFFSGGHPLTRYISRHWRSLPEVDSSGANVAYAALSLACELGAREIELYGADFSYPLGLSYARGCYIYPFFEKQQNRLKPLEAQASAFIYRGPLEKKTREDGLWYYETKSLGFYRRGLEEKARTTDRRIIPIPGMGAPIHIEPQPEAPRPPRTITLFASGKPRTAPREFLETYRDGIKKLPAEEQRASRYLEGLTGEEHSLFMTLLPGAAALKRREPALPFPELIKKIRASSINEINRVLLAGFQDF